MKGYSVADGYMGYVDGRYVLFASEADYREYLEQKFKFGFNDKCFSKSYSDSIYQNIRRPDTVLVL